MSMQRSIARNIARNQLIDNGYERPNKRLGMTANGKRGYIDTQISQRRGRKNSTMAKKLEGKMRMADPQIWKRVLCGDLKEKFKKAVEKANLRRALARQARKVHRGEAWKRVGK